MNIFKKILQKSSVMILLTGISMVSHATQITYSTDIYNNEITASGTLNGSMSQSGLTSSITPFDPTLGVLTDIQITIHGEVVYIGNSGTSYIVDPRGQIYPIPYVLQTNFGLGINGLSGDLFTLGNDILVVKTFVSNGPLGGGTISGGVGYSFMFDYSDPLDQFVGPSDVACDSCTLFQPANSMEGGINGFIDNGSLNNTLQFNSQLSFYSSGQTGIITPTTLTAHYNIHIDTIYTYDEVLPQSVPEPPTFLLALSGLFLLLRTRKRKIKGLKGSESEVSPHNFDLNQ